MPSWLAAVVRGWHELPLLQSRNLIGLNFYGFWSHSPQPAALSLELSDAIFPFGRSRQANPGVLKSKPDRSHHGKTPTTGRPGAGRTGGERRQSANHWPAVTRPGWDAQVVITCLPLTPFAAGKHTAPGNQPRRGPQLLGGECARPKLLRHLTAPSSPRTDRRRRRDDRGRPQQPKDCGGARRR